MPGIGTVIKPRFRIIESKHSKLVVYEDSKILIPLVKLFPAENICFKQHVSVLIGPSFELDTIAPTVEQLVALVYKIPYIEDEYKTSCIMAYCVTLVGVTSTDSNDSILRSVNDNYNRVRRFIEVISSGETLEL